MVSWPTYRSVQGQEPFYTTYLIDWVLVEFLVSRIVWVSFLSVESLKQEFLVRPSRTYSYWVRVWPEEIWIEFELVRNTTVYLNRGRTRSQSIFSIKWIWKWCFKPETVFEVKRMQYSADRNKIISTYRSASIQLTFLIYRKIQKLLMISWLVILFIHCTVVPFGQVHSVGKLQNLVWFSIA